MKNTLEENMLRYGIKNLSESSKHRLTEALVELMTHVNTTAALKSIQSHYAKGINSPTTVLGAEHLKVLQIVKMHMN